MTEPTKAAPSAIQKGGDGATVHLFFFESPPNVTEPTAMDQHWAFACSSSGSPSATASSNWQIHADITDEILEFETQQIMPTFTSHQLISPSMWCNIIPLEAGVQQI